MVLGLVMIGCALTLYFYNHAESEQAEQSVQEILPQIIQQLPEAPDEFAEEVFLPALPDRPVDVEMTEVTVDGNAYIGYLSIPSQGLELPILSSWSYDLLKIAPCRYHGTVKGEDLVLMAHNYAFHFGPLSNLQIGDSVTFADMDGVVTSYEVVAKDILDPYAVEEMTSGHYDLTLFTCTYGGKSRVTVYCDKV